MTGITPRLGPSNGSLEPLVHNAANNAANKTVNNSVSNLSESSSSSSSDSDFDCLELTSSDSDCIELISSSDDEAESTPTRNDSSPSTCDLFKNKQAAENATDAVTLVSPKSPAETPKKTLAVVVKVLATRLEMRLGEMQKALDAKKTYDITFDALQTVEKGIKSISKQKEWKEKGAQLSKTYKKIFACVTKALCELIELKLNVMQTAVDKGKAVEISIKSTEELNSDIRKLQFQGNEIRKGADYFKTLETLTDVITMAHVNEATKLIVKPSLMGPEIELKKRAESYSEGHVKNGLLKLDYLFVMRSIRGDGHCLFRTTLAHVLKTWLAMDSEQRNETIAKLDTKVGKFSNASLYEKYAFFKKTIHTACETGRDFSDVVCDEAVSDKLVAFLRELACEYNRQTENDVFNSFVLAIGKSKSEYLEEMMSMQKARYGDHPEVQALSFLLDINMTVVDVAEYGKNSDPSKTGQAFHHCSAHKGMMELFLLYRPGHYDLGILKVKRTPTPPSRTPSPQNRTPSPPGIEPKRSRGTRGFIEYAIEKKWIVIKA